ncbi:MAG: hypothetical protein HY854_02605 [Burkholderiales bacterium]|nr:hypothetical protein [Burkholderiales bacterium]
MGLQARYDPKQDRMLLALQYGEGERRVFWLTRRLWLGLMHELVAMKIVPTDDKAAAPPPAKKPQPLPPQPDARDVRTVRIRKLPDNGLRVAFAAEGEEQDVTLTLQREGVGNFMRLVEQQAERAGWDPRAAVERLKAGDVAKGVVRKAKGDQ